jgi:serine/threonine-protein phosphatase 2A regulatory subunit A
VARRKSSALPLIFCHIPEFNIELFQPLVKNFSKQHVLSDGLPIYRRLQSDDQDSVRLLTVEGLITIAQQMSPGEVKEQLLKQIRHSIADKSWRVRYMAAQHFNEVSHVNFVM